MEFSNKLMVIPIMRNVFLMLLISPQLLANDLVAAAKERLKHVVLYDGSYQTIAYPMGDVHKNKGVCTDVIIRAYRTLNVDLQQLVHEDMTGAFAAYPKNWGLKKPDPNIDHRRVPNLETFFQRHGQALPITQEAKDYQPGDIVSWRLNHSNLPHIGIISDHKAASGRYEVIHNIGFGPQSEDMLFAHKITGHFRYIPQ